MTTNIFLQINTMNNHNANFFQQLFSNGHNLETTKKCCFMGFPISIYISKHKKKLKKFAWFQKIIYHLFTEQYNMDISHQLEKCWAFLLNTIIKLLIGKSNQ